MNEPAIRIEEQIISLVQDREILICQWSLVEGMAGTFRKIG